MSQASKRFANSAVAQRKEYSPDEWMVASSTLTSRIFGGDLRFVNRGHFTLDFEPEYGNTI